MLVFQKIEQSLYRILKSGTTGIKTSCSNKRKLYLLYRKSNNPELKIWYKNYCKVLSKVIILDKKVYYNNKLANSTNKPKTT